MFMSTVSGAPEATPIPFGELISRRSRETPNAVYLTEAENGKTTTYAEFEKRAELWSGRLRALGVDEGDVVATMLHNEADSVAIWSAIAFIGAIEAPGNMAYKGSSLRHFLAVSQAKVLIADGEAARQAVTDVTDVDLALTTVVVVGTSDDAKTPSQGRLTMLHATDIDPVRYSRHHGRLHELASIMHTSGTTGPSKGVMVTWRQLHETALGWIPLGGLDTDGRTHSVAHLAADPVYYSPFPFHHMAARAPLHLMALLGGTVVLRRSFKTQLFWDDVREYRCTSTELLGTMALFLAGAPEQPDDLDNPLQSVLMVPLIDGVDDFNRRFGVRTYTVFNMTELSIPLVSRGYDLAADKSCGRVRDGYHCEVVDEFDEPVPPGAVGELVIRADQPYALMAGYWMNPEATVDAWRNLWFHTGDSFRRDEEGNFFFVDRLKDTIRRRGENISSLELEHEVLEHPDILECAAIGVPSDVGEEDVKLLVVVKPGQKVDEAELTEFVRDRVPAFMVPRYVEIMRYLPKTPTQKTRKTELRRSWATPETWDRSTETYLPATKAKEPQ